MRTVSENRVFEYQGVGSAVINPAVCVRNSADYSPFGVSLDGRTIESDGYRYGYQSSERDDETKGAGNSYTTFFRQLDPRVGRWFSIDPVFQPWQSPYCSMDGNPVYHNDILGNYTKKRADRMAARGERKGYKTSVLEKNGDFGVYFEKQKEGKNYCEVYFKGIFKGARHNYSFGIGELIKIPEPESDPKNNNHDETISHIIYNSTSDFDFESEPGLFDLGLAASSVLVDKGKKSTETIVKSRSGYTSGSMGNGSGKIYNKSKAKVANKVLIGLGAAINVISLANSEIDYKHGSISKARRDYNRLNGATTLLFPEVGLPTAIGDYYGQKYHKEITYQTTEGELNQFVQGILNFLGLQTTPYPRGSKEEKELLDSVYK